MDETLLEDKFKNPDGSFDQIAATAYLKSKQVKAEHLTTDELRECIQLIRILRRTTAGPTKAKTKKLTSSPIINNPDDLLKI